jgi:hypothetical protein
MELFLTNSAEYEKSYVGKLTAIVLSKLKIIEKCSIFSTNYFHL